MNNNSKYRDLSFIKKELVKQIEDLVTEKKERLNVYTLNFEQEDISDLDGVVRIGFFLSRKNDRGLVNFAEWYEIDGLTLVKVKDKLKTNKFYGEKFIKGQNCKVRLKK